jgi:hypothetical protein
MDKYSFIEEESQVSYWSQRREETFDIATPEYREYLEEMQTMAALKLARLAMAQNLERRAD